MATTDTIANYYRDLLILQYRGKDKARATVHALAKLAIVDQLPLAVQDAFDLETAIGVQLDVVGKIVGATRYGRDFDGPVTLTDDQFRDYLLICIAQNKMGSSLNDVNEFLLAFFPGILYVFDHLTMRINYFFNSAAADTLLAEFFIEANRLPCPIGVQMGAIVYLPDYEGYFGYARNTHGALTSTGYSRNTGFIGKQLRNGDFL